MLRNPVRLNKLALSFSRYFLAAVLSLCAYATTGCIESTFDLARESRLPAGIVVPAGFTRDDVFLTMDFHTSDDVKFTLRDKAGKRLAIATGKDKFGAIYAAKSQIEPGTLPTFYNVVVINGETEVFKCIPYRDGANMVQNGHIVALFEVIDDPDIRSAVLAGRAPR